MPLPIGTSLPSLDGATEWLAGDITSIAAQDRPLLVQFWSMSCPACKMNMPRLLQFLETYQNHGLRLLSIHMPRGPWEMDTDKVRTVSEELGLTGWGVTDNNHALGACFDIAKAWPTYLFFDAERKLRSRGAGQLGLKMAENSLKRLLSPGATEDAGVRTPPNPSPC